MHCVSCGAVLLDGDRYCSECGAYQPEIFTAAPQPSQPETRVRPVQEQASRQNWFKQIFTRKIRYHGETLQAFDRFAPRTPVTLTLDPEQKHLLITKGGTRTALSYQHILGFSVMHTKKEEKSIFDVLQSMIGMNRRWIATLTYQTQDGKTVKHLQFMELANSGDGTYYDEEEMSGRAKRFEKAVDKIVQLYHPCTELK